MCINWSSRPSFENFTRVRLSSAPPSSLTPSLAVFSNPVSVATPSMANTMLRMVGTPMSGVSRRSAFKVRASWKLSEPPCSWSPANAPKSTPSNRSPV